MIWVIVFFLSAAALYFLQMKLYEKFWAKGLSVHVSFSQPGVFEGGKVTLIERVTNDKWLPLPYVRLALTFFDKDIRTQVESRVSFFIVPPKKTVTKRIQILCTKRGYYPVSSVEVSSNNLFYTKHMEYIEPVHASLSVYPLETPLDEAQVLRNKLSGDVVTNRFILPDPFQYKGLREYQPFDSFKQINFKAWAKFNEPISNIYASTVSQAVHIYLCTRRYSPYQREPVYEQAIRLAAFFARSYVSDGITLRLSLSGESGMIDKITSMSGLTRVYEALARLVVSSFESLENFFNPTAASEETVLLISSYTGQELVDAFHACERRGIPCLWIIPCSQHDDDPLPVGKNIRKWVIDRG